MMFTDNKIITECLLIGIFSAICCLISYKIIYYSYKDQSDQIDQKHNISDYHMYDLNDYLFFLKIRESRNYIIMSFIFGALIHYIIKQSHLTELYCRKVCYDNKCFMVCEIKK